MVTKKMSEGVGKKIVEALKKQSEIEINASHASDNQAELEILTNELSNSAENEDIYSKGKSQDILEVEASIEQLTPTISEDIQSNIKSDATFNLGETSIKRPNQSFVNYQQTPIPQVNDNLINELDSFEIPDNIAVLKKLITQLPNGVSRHTGAQIIKQTMEALGISMKVVLQEAQQVQDGLNNSAKECFATIQEYKKQIIMLEKQAQSHQKQYAALNELISLFVQTDL